MRINLLEYFFEMLNREPLRFAVIDKERKFTFDKVNKMSNALLEHIETAVDGVIRKPIAVFLPKCAESVISDIAIIKSGNAYMNLDIKTPDTRIKAILDLIKPELIITNDSDISRVEGIWPRGKIINLSKTDLNYCYETQYEKLLSVIDTDPLCIINTSGSTGIPKGVVLNHRSFIDFTEWSLETIDLKDHEIIGCLSPVVFDIYSYELCLMMAKGATMVLIQESLAAFPARILQMMSEHEVSFIFWVPTIMTNIANMGLLGRIPLPHLHMVWFAGEVFQTKTV